MRPAIASVAALWLFAGSAPAQTLHVDRAIGREPAYQMKSPQYGLLMFGPQAKDGVWLVHDGDTLYVDRNGNGDLTEPGEKVLATNKPGRDPEEFGYSFDVGELRVGGHTHKGFSVHFLPLRRYAEGSLGKHPGVQEALARNPRTLVVSLSIDVEVPGMKGGGLGGRVTFLAGLRDLNGVLQFANSPAQAPVVHLGGPLQVTFFGERPTVRAGRQSEFTLVVGTPGVGPGTFAMIGYQDTIPESARPVAELSWPAAKSGAAPVKEKFEIKGRC